MRKSFWIVSIAGLAMASGAEARTAPPSGTPASMERLFACRGIADATQRLACYDREAGAVNQAVQTRELVLIDKARATAAKRSLFGFSIPNFGGLFGGNDAELKQIASTITSVAHNADGGWLLKLADGSMWTQVDDAELGLPPVRGNKVVVERGSLGSFYLRVGSQPGIKVRRIG